MFAVRKLLAEAQVSAADIDVIGYHGQTVAHRPDRGWTWQIGDGAVVAAATGITTVADFRSADVAAGGQGAPLLPVYHAALAAGLETPLAILNLGGVANVTWIGTDGALVAFDTGPANGLIDHWVEETRGLRFDEGGALAAAGRVDQTVLTAMLDQPVVRCPAAQVARSRRLHHPARARAVGRGRRCHADRLHRADRRAGATRAACRAAPVDRGRRWPAQSGAAADDRGSDRIGPGTERLDRLERRFGGGGRVRLYGRSAR